jgi:hypothetical protein
MPDNILKEIFGNDVFEDNGMMKTLFNNSDFNSKIKISSKSTVTTQFK